MDDLQKLIPAVIEGAAVAISWPIGLVAHQKAAQSKIETGLLHPLFK